MNLTNKQKEIIKGSIDNFEEKFLEMKKEFSKMGYEENVVEDLAWASFVMINANVTPEEYDFYYKEVYTK